MDDEMHDDTTKIPHTIFFDRISNEFRISKTKGNEKKRTFCFDLCLLMNECLPVICKKIIVDQHKKQYTIYFLFVE